MVLSIMVPHFPALGSGGMPSMPPTSIMSGWEKMSDASGWMGGNFHSSFLGVCLTWYACTETEREEQHCHDQNRSE